MVIAIIMLKIKLRMVSICANVLCESLALYTVIPLSYSTDRDYLKSFRNAFESSLLSGFFIIIMSLSIGNFLTLFKPAYLVCIGKEVKIACLFVEPEEI